MSDRKNDKKKASLSDKAKNRVRVGASAPQGYMLLACCANCLHFVMIPSVCVYDNLSTPACNLDNSCPKFNSGAWHPWTINHRVAAYGWCPSYKASQRGSSFEREEERNG